MIRDNLNKRRHYYYSGETIKPQDVNQDREKKDRLKITGNLPSKMCMQVVKHHFHFKKTICTLYANR